MKLKGAAADPKIHLDAWSAAKLVPRCGTPLPAMRPLLSALVIVKGHAVSDWSTPLTSMPPVACFFRR
jgi:hypothetical protein